jgi:hypothetical protein
MRFKNNMNLAIAEVDKLTFWPLRHKTPEAG